VRRLGLREAHPRGAAPDSGTDGIGRVATLISIDGTELDHLDAPTEVDSVTSVATRLRADINQLEQWTARPR
jgi:hypothetical protein